MKLAELTVTGFADIVSSDAPAPGGGSCAALYGAIGAALTAMVGGLTQGRKKYAEYAEHAAEVEAKGNELKARLLDVIDRDTDAFNVVSAAFGMPKDTDEQKATRSAAIQNGLKGCTKTPMEMMESSTRLSPSLTPCLAASTTPPRATWALRSSPSRPVSRARGSTCSSTSAR